MFVTIAASLVLSERGLAQPINNCPVGSGVNGALTPTDNGGTGYGSFDDLTHNGGHVGPFNDVTFSMGVFQITVDASNPNLPPLFDANTGNGWVAYPGWNGSTITSPVLYDQNTQIGRSASGTRAASFPVTVGTGADADSIANYAALHQPALFLGAQAAVGAQPGTREVFTEIQSFNLTLPGASTNCGCTPTLANMVPCLPNLPPIPMVKAGQFNSSVYPALAPLPRSVGMVQSQQNGEPNYNFAVGNTAYDFPANSFFNVFVEVDLPLVSHAGGYVSDTASTTEFPVQGAILYSDRSHALIVDDVPPNSSPEALALCGLPPAVVYRHGANTFAPKVFFAEDGLIIPGSSPPARYWYKDELLGNLVLAGHGTFKPCDPEEDFVAAVLGTENQAKAPMPIGYPVSNTLFPCHGTTYNSKFGTNLGGQTLDAIIFNAGGPTFSIRNLSVGGFSDPTNLPLTGDTVIYTNLNSTLTCDISIDGGTNYYAASGTGPVEIQITNPNGTVGDTTLYTLQVLEMSMDCTFDLGEFFLQQSADTNSFGTHIVESDTQGPVIGSTIDENFQFSSDGETFYNSDRTFHLELANPPCGAAAEPLHIERFGNGVAVLWNNPSYTLQGSTSLSPQNWVDIPGTPPVTLAFPTTYQYFRLVCE